MPRLHDEWTVLPHGRLEEVAPGVLTVVGQISLPLGKFPRRMTVVALPRKRTAIFSPIALDEASMARIEALGAPAFLIIPNGGHRLDSRPFAKRYAKAKVVAAKGAKARVNEAVRVDSATANLGRDVDLIDVAGMGDTELALLVRSGGETTLIVNDIIGNVRSAKGLGTRIMARLTGFGPKAGVPLLLKMRFIKDKGALAAQLRDWSKIVGLRRLIPSHGEIIARPAALLARLADQLER